MSLAQNGFSSFTENSKTSVVEYKLIVFVESLQQIRRSLNLESFRIWAPNLEKYQILTDLIVNALTIMI